jgi:CRP-like cAMP-binding protein
MMIRDGRQLLGRIPLFAPFRPADLDALFGCAYERSMRAGETLFQRGDPGVSMMAILAGEVRIVLPSEDGQDQVLNVLTQGAVFGEIALFDGKSRSADAVAVTNGRLLVIERAATLRLMEQDSGFAHRVVEIICARLRATIAQLDSMVFQDVNQRLVVYLLQRHDERGLARIDITQSALGRVVGSARETVNRRLRDLETQGLIALSPGRITILDRARLAALVASISPVA